MSKQPKSVSKKTTTNKNSDVNNRDVILYVSLSVNAAVLIGLISLWIIINNAGTNRYNQTVLRNVLTYTEKQFCQDEGYEKMIDEIKRNADPSQYQEVKEYYDSYVCSFDEN